MRLGQVETSKKGAPRLLIALVALSLVVTTVFFREGERGFFHGARRVALAVTAPASRLGIALTSPLRAVREGVSGIGATKREVEALRKQNADLRARLAESEEARQQNERLQTLVGFSRKHDLEGIGARIIGRSPDSWQRSILIDRGTADGIMKDMPVLANGGLVGQVVEVSARSARVRLVNDQRSGVAAIVQRTRTAGVVRGSIEGGLSLDFVSAKPAPKVGDVVITSGMGGVYPRGLVIGDITQVKTERGELFPRVDVVSRVALNEVEEVLVLTGRKGGDE